MKIHLSGPMSGYVNYGRARFDAAERWLVERGHEVFNPAKLDPSLDYETLMDINSEYIRNQADGMVLLHGHRQSKGSRREEELALDAGLALYEWPCMPDRDGMGVWCQEDYNGRTVPLTHDDAAYSVGG